MGGEGRGREGRGVVMLSVGGTGRWLSNLGRREGVRGAGRNSSGEGAPAGSPAGIAVAQVVMPAEPSATHEAKCSTS